MMTVERVKQAAAEAVKSNPDGLLYQLTIDAFYLTYHEIYDPRTDRKEFDFISRHVRRALSDSNGQVQPAEFGKVVSS